MLLVDANVLLYSLNAKSRQHKIALKWLAEALGGRETVGFAWAVLLAVLRLSTHPSVFSKPLTAGQAFDAIDVWIGAPSSLVLDPTTRHAPLLRGLLMHAGTAGNLVGDGHLAALALEHDATIVSFDRDFARFDGVRTLIPGA